MTNRVNRPHKSPGRPRKYVRDSLTKNKRGKEATKKVEAIRVKALRAAAPMGQKMADIEKRNSDRPLTDKQLKFVRAWASGETPKNAAVKAGFASGTVGYKMTHDPAIVKLYQIEAKLYEEAAQMSREKVMRMLLEAYEIAKAETEPATMVAAAREIGKMCGYYAPDVNINIRVGNKVLDRMNTLSDSELLKLLEAPEDEESAPINGEARRLSAPAVEVVQ